MSATLSLLATGARLLVYAAAFAVLLFARLPDSPHPASAALRRPPASAGDPIATPVRLALAGILFAGIALEFRNRKVT